MHSTPFSKSPPTNLLALSVAFHLPAHCYSCKSQNAPCSTQMKQVNTHQAIRGQSLVISGTISFFFCPFFAHVIILQDCNFNFFMFIVLPELHWFYIVIQAWIALDSQVSRKNVVKVKAPVPVRPFSRNISFWQIPLAWLLDLCWKIQRVSCFVCKCLNLPANLTHL